jgi:hypothetical protein
MTEFAYLLGYFVMGLASIALCLLLCSLVADYAWSQMLKARSLSWVSRAIRHYSEVEKPPYGDSK